LETKSILVQKQKKHMSIIYKQDLRHIYLSRLLDYKKTWIVGYEQTLGVGHTSTLQNRELL
jgi:hypothetical protein